MMNMDAIKKIQGLRANARELYTFWGRYRAHTAKESIDKYGAGFGVGRDLYSFKVNTTFYAYSGSYGSSSVYSFGRFDADVVQPYIIRAMNDLSEEIFSKAAELMNADAATYVDRARDEVAAMSKLLDDAVSDVGDAEVEG